VAGHYAALLAEQDADVVGIDASEGMVEVARDRHGDLATFGRADLRDPLPFGDGAFDLVLCKLTLEHVRNWDPVASGFARALDADGRLVVSTDHPFGTYFVIEHEPPEIGAAGAQAADYYAIEGYDRDWGDDDDPLLIPFYRRPLREVLRPWCDAGFVLEDLPEPSPETDNELLGYFDAETPRFIGFRARLLDD
jgi:SAM-dependent methyltransferase